MPFDGDTYDTDRDHYRLAGQLDRVFDLMCDGEWHVLEEIADVAGGTVASASARLRDLRKAKFGGHVVLREYVDSGLWKYRLVVGSECCI